MSCALLHPDVGLHLTAMLSPALSASDIVTAAAADVIRLQRWLRKFGQEFTGTK